MIDSKPETINEQVARKLGWTQSVNEFYFDWWVNPKNQLYSKTPPNFCEDIEAAWEIPELESVIRLEDGRWYATFEFVMAEAIADTAPMAICLAFLKRTANP